MINKVFRKENRDSAYLQPSRVQESVVKRSTVTDLDLEFESQHGVFWPVEWNRYCLVDT